MKKAVETKCFLQNRRGMTARFVREQMSTYRRSISETVEGPEWFGSEMRAGPLLFAAKIVNDEAIATLLSILISRIFVEIIIGACVMGCRCNERRDALRQGAAAAMRGNAAGVKQAATFVSRTLIEDVRRGELQRAAMQQRLANLRRPGRPR